jgi:O-acetyl-ADP-ribose deacetylase (regulator of RNase III)
MTKVKVVLGDITKLKTDAIVNAANVSLRGGGGVDGAIHRAAGLGMLQELTEKYPDGIVVGEAVASFGHKLKAMYVIHTVGPRYYLDGVDHAKLLADGLSRYDADEYYTGKFVALRAGEMTPVIVDDLQEE